MFVYNPWKILHLKVLHSSLVVAISLDHLYRTTRILLRAQPLISLQKNNNLNLNYKNEKKHKTTFSAVTKNYINVGLHSLYHGIFTNFWHHNALSYNYEEKTLIISLLMNHKLVKTPRKVSLNAKVASWNGSP
jgi:hypothetical protein